MNRYLITLLLVGCYTTGVLAQNKLRGRVSDLAGYPLINASVKTENGTIGTVTDTSGNFTLSVDNNLVYLVISHIGYKSVKQEIRLPYPGILIIQLEPGAMQLEEVRISTGYQEIPRERATGSFSFIDNKTFNEQVSTDVLSRLEAVANGVSVNRTTVNTNGLTIRGFSTIMGSKEPLIVVDNFPYEGDINNINPNSVENITILKDAAASSIWGARAGNGVIVITTKKGNYNKPLTVEVNSNLTLSEQPDLSYLPQMSSADYIDMEKFLFSKGYKFADTSSTRFAPFTPAYEILFSQRKGAINESTANSMLAELAKTDIRDEYSRHMYRSGIKQQHAVSLNGGSERVSWLFIAGLDKNLSEQYQTYDRLNLNFRNTYNPTKSLQVNTALFYTQSKSGRGRIGYDEVGMSNQQLPPYIRFADENGRAMPVTRNYRQTYIDTIGKGQLLDWNYYMKDEHVHSNSEAGISDINLNFGATYPLLKWLKADLKYQYQRQASATNTVYGQESYFARNLINEYSQLNRATGKVTYIVPLGGIRDQSDALMSSNSLRAQINSDHNFGKHSLVALLGAEIRDRRSAGSSNNIYGYNPDILTYVNVDYATSYPNLVNGSRSFIPNSASFSGTNNRFVSGFFNGAYSYDNRYILSTSMRRDASNLFGVTTNEKWNLLWSAGAAWNISNEKFYNSALLPYLKLRATYGFSGNVDPAQSAVTTLSFRTSNPYTGTRRGIISQYGNPGLTWEKVGMMNLALDFSSKNNRVYGSVDFFRKKATDLFGKAPMDYTTGIPLTGAVRNVASIKGEGLDLDLNGLIIDKVVKWSANLNYSHYIDEVVDYYKGTFTGRDFLTSRSPQMTGVIGMPLHSFYSYKWQGLDPANGDPIGFINGHNSKNYAAITGDSTKVSDLVYSGSAVPTSYGSLGNTLSWKNFSVSVRLLYKFGYYYRRQGLHYANLFASGRNAHPEYTSRWQKPGDELNTHIPSMVYPAVSNRDNLYANSEIMAEKGDHIRLQYITLSYTLRKSGFRYFPFQSSQIYLNMNNLGLVWRANKEGRDPEYSSLVPSRNLAISLKLTL